MSDRSPPKRMLTTPSDLFRKIENVARSYGSEFVPYMAVVQGSTSDGFTVLRKEDDTASIGMPSIDIRDLKVGQRVVVQPMPDGFDVILGPVVVGVQGYSQLLRSTEHRLMEVYADGGAATFSTKGMPAPTITAAGGASSFTTLNQPWVALDTGGSANGDGKLVSPFTTVRPEWKPSLWVRFFTWQNVTQQRIWVGMFSADPMSSSSPNLNFAAFRYVSGTDDNGGIPTWRCVTGDGSARTATFSTVTVGTSAMYELRIDLTSTLASFFINGVLATSISTNMPTGDLGIVVGLRTLDATVRRARISRIAVAYP